MTSRKDRVTLTLDPGILAAVDEIAARRELSRSAMIERILEVGLRNYDEQVAELEGPLTGALARAILKSPALFDLLAGALNREMTSEEVQRFRQERASDLEVATARRRAKKKRKPGEGK